MELGRETARIVLSSPCVICGNELPWRARTGSCCGDCWRNLPGLDRGKCQRCAIPWSGDEPRFDFFCIPCRNRVWDLEWIDAWGPYDRGLDVLVQAFKFARHDFLAGPLAGLLVETWRARSDTDFDAVVGIPMHSAKKRQRGFNQAELLAREFARLTGIPHRPSLLIQKEQRATQASLPRDARTKNVSGIYRAVRVTPASSILLIDDICTTGATLNAGARALLAQGARRVCALVVARA